MTRKPLRQPGSKAKGAAPVKAPTMPARKAASTRAPRAPPTPDPDPPEAPAVPPLATPEEVYHVPEQHLTFESHYGDDDEPRRDEESVQESPTIEPSETNGKHVEPPLLFTRWDGADSTVVFLADPADAYADLAPAMVANPRVWFRIRGSVPASEAVVLGQKFADRLQLQVDIVGDSGQFQTLLPQPPGRLPRIKAADRDWTVRPEVTAGANLGINKLLKRIEAARGDLANLESFIGTFRGSIGTPDALKKASTYYRVAGRYLHGLIAEARGAAVEHPSDGENLHAA